jgi:hypothetical protein
MKTILLVAQSLLLADGCCLDIRDRTLVGAL